MSFVESLSTQLNDERERDERAAGYIRKFRMKKVKDELLRACYEVKRTEAKMMMMRRFRLFYFR